MENEKVPKSKMSLDKIKLMKKLQKEHSESVKDFWGQMQRKMFS